MYFPFPLSPSPLLLLLTILTRWQHTMTHVGSPNASEIYGNLRALNAFGTFIFDFASSPMTRRWCESRNERSRYPYVGYHWFPSPHVELDFRNSQTPSRCKLCRKFPTLSISCLLSAYRSSLSQVSIRPKEADPRSSFLQ